MKLILMAIIFLFTVASHASDNAEKQLYDVELLVFQQLVDSDDGEIWPVDISAWFNEAPDALQADTVPEFTDGRTISEFGSRPKISNGDFDETMKSEKILLSEQADPIDKVNWLAGGEYKLLDEAAALRRSSGFRPLAHIAWRQVAADRNLAKPIRLPASEKTKTGAYIDGKVKLSLGRYLHLDLNLQFHEVLGTDLFEQPEFDIPEIRLEEKRRMRSRKLHYFDHPRFGVLAIITPYEAPFTPANNGIQ